VNLLYVYRVNIMPYRSSVQKPASYCASSDMGPSQVNCLKRCILKAGCIAFQCRL